jgi:DNA-binding NarL/FixJ family response regulator
MQAFRILVVDRHPIFRLGLWAVLGSHGGWEVCGEAVDGPDAAQKCIQLKPDLMIMEICMARLNGIEVAGQILQANPAQRILVLTDADSEGAVRHCLQAGICGWILKSDSIEDLMTAVKAVQDNASHDAVHSAVHGAVQHTDLPARTPAVLVRGRWKGNPGRRGELPSPLSPREQEVLQLVAEGKSSKDVATILNIAEKTAVTHRTNLMSKLDLHSVARLVIYAVRNEVIHVPLRDVIALPIGSQVSSMPSVVNP